MIKEPDKEVLSFAFDLIDFAYQYPNVEMGDLDEISEWTDELKAKLEELKHKLEVV